MGRFAGNKAIAWGLASAAVWTVVGVGLGRSDMLAGARLFWTDQLFAARQHLDAEPPPHPDVLIVGIDEPTRRQLRQQIGGHRDDRYLNRYAIGQSLLALNRAGARVVAVDYFLDRPIAPEVDVPVLQAMAGDERLGIDGMDVVLASLLTVRETKRPDPQFRDWAAEGNVALVPDADGKFRRVQPGLVSLDGQVPIFAFQACRVYVGEPDEYGSRLGTQWRWHDGVGEDGSVEVPGRFRAPWQTLIDFAGPAQTWRAAGQQFSAIDLIDGRIPPETFRDKLVILGPTLRNTDRFSVTVAPPRDDQRYRELFEQEYGVDLDELAGVEAEVELTRSGAMSGVEIHANVASQILRDRYIHVVGAEPGWLGPAVTAGVLIGLGWLFWQDPRAGRRRALRSIVGGGLLLAVVLAAMVAASVVAFVEYRTLIVPLGLLVAWTGQGACGMVYSSVRLRRQSRRIERMFGSAVGEGLLAYINAHPEVMTTNTRRTATVLFCDIRGFTPLAERLGSDQVIRLLREHFQTLWEPLAEEGAWVDKYVGDLVMAAWNVLEPMDDHALRGVRAAVKMKLALADLNRQRRAAGKEPIVAGIGLHSGELVGGNVGSSQRSNFTIVGTTVNLASRIEGQTSQGEILISAQTADAAGADVLTRPFGSATLKGLGERELHEVLGLRGGPYVPGLEDAARAAEAERLSAEPADVIATGPA